MAYTVLKSDGEWSLENETGETIIEGQPLPLRSPDDIIDAILDDMGVGNPQREGFKTLFKQDWEIVDEPGE